MKYLFQIFVIMFFVFLGEILGYIIPLPIAGSIYGLILLFVALVTGVVKLEWVADVADWLHSIMSLFFVVSAVAVIDVWGEISDMWWQLLLVLVAAYFVTMFATGLTARALIKPDKSTEIKRNTVKQTKGKK